MMMIIVTVSVMVEDRVMIIVTVVVMVDMGDEISIYTSVYD